MNLDDIRTSRHAIAAGLLALAFTACGGGPANPARDAGLSDAPAQNDKAAPDAGTEALCCSAAEGGSLLACDPGNPFPCYVGSRAEICTQSDCRAADPCDGLSGLGTVVTCAEADK